MPTWILKIQKSLWFTGKCIDHWSVKSRNLQLSAHWPTRRIDWDCMFAYVIANRSLQGNIKMMDVVEDFESRPQKALTFVVKRNMETQEVSKLKMPKALWGYSGGKCQVQAKQKVGKKRRRKMKRGANFVLFHPLTSFEVKTRTIFDIFKLSREIKHNYAKLSDEGPADPKTPQLDIENIQFTETPCIQWRAARILAILKSCLAASLPDMIDPISVGEGASSLLQERQFLASDVSISNELLHLLLRHCDFRDVPIFPTNFVIWWPNSFLWLYWLAVMSSHFLSFTGMWSSDELHWFLDCTVGCSASVSCLLPWSASSRFPGEYSGSLIRNSST